MISKLIPPRLRVDLDTDHVEECEICDVLDAYTRRIDGEYCAGRSLNTAALYCTILR